MKKYKFILIAALAMTVVSCEDFLNWVPENETTVAGFFQSDADATAAMQTIYAQVYNQSDPGYGRKLMWEIGGGSDDVLFGRNASDRWNNLANFHYPTAESGDNSPGCIHRNSAVFWPGITNSNWLIYNLLRKQKEAPLTEVEKRTLGEAYFMRAQSHLLIAYRHGRPDLGVPFNRWEDFDPYDESSIPEQQTTVMKNYDLIIQDLDKAYELLPWFDQYSEDDYGRAHKAAALGYKIKVLAFWGQYDETKWAEIPALVDKVENDNGHTRGLLDSYYDVFTVAHNWDKEYIWAINGSAKTRAPVYFGGVSFIGGGWNGWWNTWGCFKPTADLYMEFAKSGLDAKGRTLDKRRYVTMIQVGDPFTYFELDGSKSASYTEDNTPRSRVMYDNCANKGNADGSGFAFIKYMDPWRYGTYNAETKKVENTPFLNAGDECKSDLNLPLMRFAELILFKAEAKLRLGQDATTELNRIAKRAGLGDNYYDGSTPLKTANFDALMHERRCELAFEYSDRFKDLRRWAGDDKCPGKDDALAKLRAPKHAFNPIPSKMKDDKGETLPDGFYYYGFKVPYPDPDPSTPGIEGSIPQDPDLSTQENEAMLDLNNYEFGAPRNEGAYYAGRAEYPGPQDAMTSLPYYENDIIKSGGKLKRNPGYPLQ